MISFVSIRAVVRCAFCHCHTHCIGPCFADVDFSTLEEFSVASCTDMLVSILHPSAQKPSVEKVSQRVDKAMSRPGPSVRAEDLTQAPFAGNIELIAPSKYR